MVESAKGPHALWPVREIEVKRSIALALTCTVAAAIPGAGRASSSALEPTRHHRAAHRHARAPVDAEAVARAEAVASGSSAWVPFVGSFSVPFATPPAPLAWPKIAPYPPGQGDTDGLSTDIDDCNKGCIGGQPN